MRVSIFGIGYVGAVSAACLARDGHSVVAVDSNRTKVELVNRGLSPVVEGGLDDLIASGVAEGRLRAVTDPEEAISSSQISLVCVGTPSRSNGSQDMGSVQRVCTQIGGALQNKTTFHTVALRSTVVPGTTRDLVIPLIEKASGRRVGHGYSVCVNPEFLREGSAIEDYSSPAKILVGALDPTAAASMKSMYDGVRGPFFETTIEMAEMIKYADNSWHALKVCFANEIGNICKSLAIDSHQVMNILCSDTRLNISSKYMKPGFAFGGSCLPKDVRALIHKTRMLDLDVPVLEAILPSNRCQVQRGIELIRSYGKKKIGVLGLAFKAGTDDLRESPLVEVVETLIGKGYQVRIYDRSVTLATLKGANREYILSHIPHVAELLTPELDDVLEFGEVLVVGNNAQEFAQILSRKKRDQIVVDLVRIGEGEGDREGYAGICW
jgi:GDP-mannose 6-dehydrogenase